MLEAKTLTVGFSDSEDRLWLRLGTDSDGAVQLWLTRRVLQSCTAPSLSVPKRRSRAALAHA